LIKNVLESAMRTTVTLDEELVRELVKVSDARNKTSAVMLAVKEQIRRAKLKKLMELLGTVDVDEEAVKESKEADLKRAEWLEKIGREDDR
jgi:hypothetical protein